MTKHVAVLFFVAFMSMHSIAQVSERKGKCSCSVLIAPEFKGEINLLTAPGGKLKKTLKHNFKKEDFVILDVKEWSGDFIYVSANYSFNGTIGKGWVKMNNAIGIYTRNYDPKDSLVLYSTPNTSSKKNFIIKKYTSKLWKVTGCQGVWLRVQMKDGNIQYQGWVQPDMQCASPYTTCN